MARYECDNCDCETDDVERVAAHLRSEPTHTMRDEDSTYTLGATRAIVVDDGASDAPHEPAAGITPKLPRVRIEQRSADVNNIGVRIDGKELHGLRRVEVVFDAEDIPRVTLTLHADAVDIDADLFPQLYERTRDADPYRVGLGDPERYLARMGDGRTIVAGSTMAASMAPKGIGGAAFAEKYLRVPPVARWTIVRALGILTGPAIDTAIDGSRVSGEYVSGDYIDTHVYSAALHAGRLAELERALDEWTAANDTPEPDA